MTWQEGQAVSTLQQLIALEEIKRLKSRYTRLVDTRQWEPLAECMTEDIRFMEHIVSFGCEGRDTLLEALKGAMVDQVSVHQVIGAEVELLGEDRAKGIFQMQDYLVFPPGKGYPGHPYPSTKVNGYGYYVDSFVKSGGVWRIASMEIYRIRHEVSSYGSTEVPDVLKG